MEWHSYPLYILASMPKRNIATNELIRISVISDELLPRSHLDSATASFLGIASAGGVYSVTTPVRTGITAYDWNSSPSAFDDYLTLPISDPQPDLLIGIKYDGYNGSLLGLSNGAYIAVNAGKGVWISVQFHKDERIETLCDEDMRFGYDVARSADYRKWAE